MVFFTCNACGESLKKAQVDKHLNMCRGCQILSCIDCGKDFWGYDYKNHMKCISEDQKYGGKGFEAKANKGDVKQQQWIQRVHEAMNKPGVSGKLRNVLSQVSAYDNVPRKRAKFQNWMKNSLRIVDSSLQDEVWDILAEPDNAPEATQETKASEQNEAEVESSTNGNEKQNGQPNMEKKKLNKRERKEARQQKNAEGAEKTVASQAEEDQAGKKKKKDRKRKHGNEEACDDEWSIPGVENVTSITKTKSDESIEAAEAHESESEDQPAPRGKFSWKENIRAILKEAPGQELPVKRLRKKVLAAYYTFTSDDNFKTKEEVLALFNKKISNNRQFRVLKERVSLKK